MPPTFPNLAGDTSGLPATTRSGIPYEIDVFSYREQWVPGANRTTVVCRVLWAQAFDWITDMVGQANVTNQQLSRDPPEQNPLDPNQYCTRVEQVDQGGLPEDDGSTLVVDVSGSGDYVPTFADPSHGWPVTEWCRYRCTFEGFPFWVKTDYQVDQAYTEGFEKELERYVVRTKRGYVKEQELPGGGYKIVNDGDPDARDTLMTTSFKFVPYDDVTYTWFRVPVTAFNSMAAKDDLRGFVNNAAWDTHTGSNGGYNWPTETLMYVSYDDSNKYFDANDDWVVDVVYTFRAKRIKDRSSSTVYGWNYFLNNLGDPVAVSSDGTSSGTKPYPTGDLNTLFRLS